VAEMFLAQHPGQESGGREARVDDVYGKRRLEQPRAFATGLRFAYGRGANARSTLPGSLL